MTGSIPTFSVCPAGTEPQNAFNRIIWIQEDHKKMAKRSIIPVFIPHAGCPNGCIFCDQRAITGRISVPSFSDVSSRIASALAQLPPDAPAPELAFYGGSFTALDPSQQLGYLRAAQPFLQSERISSIRVSTRPDAIGDSELSLLASNGVKTIELGAQSMDDEVLRRAMRGHTAMDTEKAARLVRESGFSLVLQMMAGLPGDSFDIVWQSARRIAALRPDAVRIYPVVVLRGTPLFDLWQSGGYAPLSVEDAVPLCAALIDMFWRESIPIIRIGLNPDEALASDVAAGAYHPALGELCYSRWYLDRIRAQLALLAPVEEVCICVHPSRISVAVGQRRRNIDALKQEFPSLRKLAVRPHDRGLDELFILQPDNHQENLFA